jgi:putative FmdB family regulatory protein
MPTYEYICETCGHHFEQIQPISAKPLKVCPEELCAQKPWRKGKVKRAISGGAGVIFKGSGFYITDYRSSQYKEAAKKESASASGAESKPTTTSAAKPAAAKPERSTDKAPPAKN